MLDQDLILSLTFPIHGNSCGIERPFIETLVMPRGLIRGKIGGHVNESSDL